jgi:multidrug efflux pump subunit AcrB
MNSMDIVERLKVDIEMLSMSPDEKERLISTTLEMALNEIQHLRKKNSDSDYLSYYFTEWHDKKNVKKNTITNIDVGEI